MESERAVRLGRGGRRGLVRAILGGEWGGVARVWRGREGVWPVAGAGGGSDCRAAPPPFLPHPPLTAWLRHTAVTRIHLCHHPTAGLMSSPAKPLEHSTRAGPTPGPEAQGLPQRVPRLPASPHRASGRLSRGRAVRGAGRNRVLRTLRGQPWRERAAVPPWSRQTQPGPWLFLGHRPPPRAQGTALVRVRSSLPYSTGCGGAEGGGVTPG